MCIFQGLQVQVGKWRDKDERLIPVEVRYAHPDKVVAAILAENTQNKPIKLPAVSAYASGFKLNMARARGVGTERRNTYTPVGGLVPNDMVVVHQAMPVPYDLTIELNVYASNTDQHFQLLEQILPLFDPSLTFQTSDAPFDWTRLTCVTLTDVTLNTNFAIGTDKRIVQSTLLFEIPVELSTPADVRKDFIQTILMRIGTVSASANMNDSYEIVAELDAQGLPYDIVASTDNLPFQ